MTDDTEFDGPEKIERIMAVRLDKLLQDRVDRSIYLSNLLHNGKVNTFEDLKIMITLLLDHTNNSIIFDIILHSWLFNSLQKGKDFPLKSQKKELEFMSEMLKLVAGTQSHLTEDVEEVRDRQGKLEEKTSELMLKIQEYFKWVEENK